VERHTDDAASRQLNPSLIQLYQKFRPRGFEIISIALDDNLMAWRKAIEQDGISIWTNGSDLKGRSSDIAALYMVGTVPYTVLIGEDNKIIAKGLLGDDLTRQLNELTKKKKK
jgi:alkyl hydroperoxide reductase subunit AhpC